MKTLSALALGAAISSTFVVALPSNQNNAGKFLVETAPGESRWVTEAEKLAMKKDGKNFMDITSLSDLITNKAVVEPITYPSELQHQDAVTPLLDALSTDNLKNTVTEYSSSFTNRYYKADTGVEAANWLFDHVDTVVKDAGIEGATAEKVQHSGFDQPSIVVHIPGQSENLVVAGAHLDSINGDDPTGPAPGADDNGSGSSTILEALRVLLTSEEVKGGKATNSIEFHWYAGEEGGTLGSLEIFSKYKEESKRVVGMLNQDMTGYIQGTLDAGKPESFGLVTDNIDTGLTDFTKLIIDGYTDIPYVETQCGYACSDHASANKNGFPAAFVFESDFDLSHPDIHSPGDTLEHVDINHMQQHSRLVLGFVYELGFAEL